MKNMKVAKKLIVGFLIVALLVAIVGVVGIFGMGQINNASHYMFNKNTKPLPDIAKAIEYGEDLRVSLRDLIIDLDDPAALRVIEADIYESEELFAKYMAAYKAAIVDDASALQLFNEADKAYNNDFKPALDEALSLAKAGADPAELVRILDRVDPASQTIVDKLTECMDLKLAAAEEADLANTRLYNTVLIITIAAVAIAVIISILLALYISGLIAKPLSVLSAFMKKAGSTGDIAMRPEDMETVAKFVQIRDEIGETIGATASFIEHVTEVSKALETIAGGDLTVNVKLASDADTMGISLKSMIGNLNHMFNEISSATSQVYAGSKQIADGAQALAAGSTEQASSVQELAASLNDVSTSTNHNADMAKEAADLSGNIKTSAEKGSLQMDQMMQAVTQINDASSSISKVIKVIDDIAFQTNILALNAAVEAARAGQHGKGFAVVAEEVRNLAAKSAEAAKDTSSLIENSIEKANFGMSIATETSESLHEIVEGINRNAEIIIRIEESSENQAKAINQISIGIDQVAQVVQQNSATAEESAAASEEMSGQAAMLEQLISHFKLQAEDERLHAFASSSPASATPAYEEPAYTAPAYTPPAPEVYSTSYDSSDKY